MNFTPRTTKPDASDKYWIQVGSGGYNRCMYVTGNSVMPNCTGYAYGRFMEIMGATSCNLSTRNAGLWYGNTGDGYQRGSTAKLGAILCYEKPGDAGHVAIVEQVNSDGSIMVSESGYQHAKYFWTKPIGADYKYGPSSPFRFQGFIYNPAITNNTSVSTESKLFQFISEAKSHVGEKSNWVASLLGCGDIEWCCAFIIACAKEVGGLVDVIIPNTYSCTALAKAGGEGKFGSKFIKGPRHGNSVKPQAGDIILFNRTGGSVYNSDHSGIVYEVIGDSIHTIEGNTSTLDRHTSKAALREYDYTNQQINGYFRPDWSKVGSSITDLAQCAVGWYDSLYTSKNTRADATIREVGYVKGYQPSTSKTEISLSVINYTDLLASFFSGSSASYSDTNINTDAVDDTKARAVLEYLLGKGLNAAAACGVCGNIEHESVPPYNTASVGDYGSSFGICQWHNERGTAMKKMAGSNWASNLTGQLDYLWYELTNVAEFSELFTILQSVPNSEDGAKTAADKFVRIFERPKLIETQSKLRQESALNLFHKLAMNTDATPVSI